jgi:hypothetical protein
MKKRHQQKGHRPVQTLNELLADIRWHSHAGNKGADHITKSGHFGGKSRRERKGASRKKRGIARLPVVAPPESRIDDLRHDERRYDQIESEATYDPPILSTLRREDQQNGDAKPNECICDGGH